MGPWTGKAAATKIPSELCGSHQPHTVHSRGRGGDRGRGVRCAEAELAPVSLSRRGITRSGQRNRQPLPTTAKPYRRSESDGASNGWILAATTSISRLGCAWLYDARPSNGIDTFLPRSPRRSGGSVEENRLLVEVGVVGCLDPLAWVLLIGLYRVATHLLGDGRRSVKNGVSRLQDGAGNRIRTT